MIPRRFTGIAARDIMRTHLKAIGFAMFVLLVVAIAIDMTKFLDDIRAKAAADQVSLTPMLLEYLVYRSADIITHLLPMACLTGSFIAELLRHQRMEPVILAAAGASPTVMFAALLWVGLVTGGVQTALEGWLRPAAVFAQARMELGGYGDRFKHVNMGNRWFIDGELAIEARVMRSNPPELQDIRQFEGLGSPALTRIIEARSAEPTDTPLVWQLKDAVVWQGSKSAYLQPERHERLNVTMPFSDTHIRFYGVPAYFLPNDLLWEMAALKDTQRTADAEIAVMRRFAALFLPGVFAFLGATLSQCGRDGRMLAWWRLLVLGTVGYITVVSVKSFWTLGEFEVVSPLVATTVPISFAFLLGAALQLFLNGLPERQRAA